MNWLHSFDFTRYILYTHTLVCNIKVKVRKKVTRELKSKYCKNHI